MVVVAVAAEESGSQICAVSNEAGTIFANLYINLVTPPLVQPSGVEATYDDDSTALIRWTAAPEGTEPVTYYEVAWDVLDGGQKRIVSSWLLPDNGKIL